MLSTILDRVSLANKLAFTLSEVAALLSVSTRQVDYWISSGALASVILPETTRARRVTSAQLEAFVQGAEIAHGFRRPKILGRVAPHAG